MNDRYFRAAVHPYATFEDIVRQPPGRDKTLLDAGCQRGVPVLRKLAGTANELINVDLIDFDRTIDGIT